MSTVPHVAVAVGVILGLAVVAAVVYALAFSSRQRLRRRLARLPLAPINAAGPPLAKIRGQAEGEPALRAPLSGRACFAYQVHVEAAAEVLGAAIASEARGIDFLLRDETGVARVRLLGSPVTIMLTADHRSDGRGLADPAFVDGFRERHGIPLDPAFRYAEAALLPGATVVVAGAVGREPDPGAAGDGYREIGTG